MLEWIGAAELMMSLLPDDKKKKVQKAVGIAIDLGSAAIIEAIDSNKNKRNSMNGTFFPINSSNEIEIDLDSDVIIEAIDSNKNKRNSMNGTFFPINSSNEIETFKCLSCGHTISVKPSERSKNCPYCNDSNWTML